MAEAPNIDPGDISAEQFAQLIAHAENDEQIEEGLRAAGTGRVLERIFSEMQERFQPERAQGVDADVQWIVRDEGEEHAFAAQIRDGTCVIEPGRIDSPKVTLSMGLAPFAKLVSGQAQGPQLFMTGKLSVSGDLFLAQRLTGFFDRPEPPRG
jgi:putative sterol carrier protein